MKKFAVAVASVLVAASITVAASGSGGGGTVVFEDFLCGILDGNGNVFLTTDSETILYSNQQGTKAVLRCSGNGAPAASLTYFTGFGCNTQFGFTTDSVDKVGRNGNSQLTCTIHLENGDNASSSGTMGAAG